MMLHTSNSISTEYVFVQTGVQNKKLLEEYLFLLKQNKKDMIRRIPTWKEDIFFSYWCTQFDKVSR